MPTEGGFTAVDFVTIASPKYIFLRPADEAKYRLTFPVDEPHSTRQVIEYIGVVQASRRDFAPHHRDLHFALSQRSVVVRLWSIPELKNNTCNSNIVKAGYP